MYIYGRGWIRILENDELFMSPKLRMIILNRRTLRIAGEWLGMEGRKSLWALKDIQIGTNDFSDPAQVSPEATTDLSSVEWIETQLLNY